MTKEHYSTNASGQLAGNGITIFGNADRTHDGLCVVFACTYAPETFL